MTDDTQNTKEEFLYPIGNYYGEFSPERLIFNANLQEFSHKVSYLCALQSNGKITAEESYKEIKKLWKQLKASKNELLGDSNTPHDNPPPA